MLISIISFAQQVTYGKDLAGYATISDRFGNSYRTGSTNINGDFVWLDYGNVAHVESKTTDEKKVSKDNCSNEQIKQSSDHNGNKVVKDQYGNIQYVLLRDKCGNIVKKIE